MGDFLKEDDIYVGGLLQHLNLRFAPAQGTASDPAGGIAEMAAIQKEFEIFKVGRSFRSSVAALGLATTWHSSTRTGWYAYLDSLGAYPEADGDSAIVKAIIDDLAAPLPLPIYFTSHDMREKEKNRVIITPNAQPLFYLEQPHLVISLPMRPRSRPRAKSTAKSK